jgi:hypothetical protein
VLLFPQLAIHALAAFRRYGKQPRLDGLDNYQVKTQEKICLRAQFKDAERCVASECFLFRERAAKTVPHHPDSC